MMARVGYFFLQGLGALVAGTAVGVVLLAIYFMFDPYSQGSAKGGLAILVLFPVVVTFAAIWVFGIGCLPTYFLGWFLTHVFNRLEIDDWRYRSIVAAGVGGWSGYLILYSNLSYWGDAVPGAFFGSSIMASWFALERFASRFLGKSAPQS